LAACDGPVEYSDTWEPAFRGVELLDVRAGVRRSIKWPTLEGIVFKGDCWIFTGKSKTSSGYGQIHVDGRHWQTHRLSWTLWNGPIPDGQCVLHRCDTPLCVNPVHLFLGTRADNNADRARKGRNAPIRGERNPRARVSDAQADEIRALYRQGQLSQREIAALYDIAQVTVSHIVRGKRMVA
jgi:hypothetical protein